MAAAQNGRWARAHSMRPGPQGVTGLSGGHRTRTCTGLRPAVFKTAALPVRSSPPDCYYGTYAAAPWREVRSCAVTVPLAGENRFPTAEARSASSMMLPRRQASRRIPKCAISPGDSVQSEVGDDTYSEPRMVADNASARGAPNDRVT